MSKNVVIFTLGGIIIDEPITSQLSNSCQNKYFLASKKHACDTVIQIGDAQTTTTKV